MLDRKGAGNLQIGFKKTVVLCQNGALCTLHSVGVLHISGDRGASDPVAGTLSTGVDANVCTTHREELYLKQSQ